jgi:parvulin-like peptidyl-prolyl isomerase
MNKYYNVHLSFVIIVLLSIFLTSCVESKPPYYGAFIKDGSKYIELAQRDAFGIPSESELEGVELTQNSQPVIILWQPNINLQYLQFFSVTNNNELQYHAVPKDNGIIELTSADKLEPGFYCYIQGDPMGAILPAWCFEISSGLENPTVSSISNTTEKTNPLETEAVDVLDNLPGYELVQQTVPNPEQPVAIVDGVSISTKDFQTFVRYEWLQYFQQYQQYQQFAQLFGSDQPSQSYIQQYLAQIEYQMEPTNLGQSALDYLVANVIIQKEAQKRGIKVTDSKVTQALESYMGFYPNGTPTTVPTSVPVPTSTLNPTQLKLVHPKTVIVANPTGISPTNTPQPISTPYTTQAYAKDLSTYMANINSLVGLSETDFRWILQMQLLQQKVLEAVTAGDSHQQDQVWARQIVSNTQYQAESVYRRLQNGEDFMTLANEVMSGSTYAIDLGWLGKGILEANADIIVWSSMIGQISEPIQTSNGWVIYQLLGHEVRTLTDAQYSALQKTNFQYWIETKKAISNIQIFDNWKNLVTTSPTFPPTDAP